MVARGRRYPTRPDIEMQSVPRYLSLKSICTAGEVHIAWLENKATEINGHGIVDLGAIFDRDNANDLCAAK